MSASVCLTPETSSFFTDLMTMRRSPRRPLILRRRKLPFQQNDPPAAASGASSGVSSPKSPASSQCFPDGIRIVDHPSMSDTQLVVIPKTADLQSVIGALTAKGKECGAQGPNKFILLGSPDNGAFCRHPAEGRDDSARAAQPVTQDSVHSPDAKPLPGIKTCMGLIFSRMLLLFDWILTIFFPSSANRDLDCGLLDDSLTNIQWLGKMNTYALDADPAKQDVKEKQNEDIQILQVSSSSDWYTSMCVGWGWGGMTGHVLACPQSIGLYHVYMHWFFSFWFNLYYIIYYIIYKHDIKSVFPCVSSTGTKRRDGCRICPAVHIREAAVLLHGHDPVCHQQPVWQEDDSEGHLLVDRGTLPLLQRGGQARMEGALEPQT